MFGLRSQNRTTADKETSLEALPAAVARLGKLPMLPETAHRALALSNNPKTPLNALAALIERDVTLATGILKLANSPLYRIGRSVESVNQAVVRLGLRETQSLLITTSMRTLFNKAGQAKKLQCQRLWQHSFLTACLCRQLNRTLKLGYQGEEFACGLSHDIGRILIAIGAPKQFDAVDPMSFQEGPETLAHEKTILGTDHCFFGAWFADNNDLPASLVRSIQFHHTPGEAGEHQGLVGLIATADHMANHIQLAESVQGYEIQTNPGWFYITLTWDDARRQQTEEAILQVMAQASDEAMEVVKVVA
ncbi:MAG TPA: HDOD domain-containing protein [Gemmataceae bacterium]|nr:HDOD domain-containing protein [Gemmataceae bacterium]